MFCEGCGAGNYETSRFCYSCGRPLPVSPASGGERVVATGTVFCGECGAGNADRNRFCNACGRPIGRLPGNGTEIPAAEPPHAPALPAQPEFPVPVAQPLSGKIVLFGSIATGLVSFFILPYVLSVVAIILGAVTLAGRNRMGAIGVVIGIGAILTDYSYIHFLTYVAG